MLTVIAIAPAAHTTGNTVCVEHVLVVLARIGAALVGMVKQAGVGAASLQGHLERLDGQMTVVDGAHGPSHDEPGEQIQDRREVELPALVVAIDTQSPFYPKEIYSELDQLRKLVKIELSDILDAGAGHVSSRHSRSEFWLKLRDGSDRISDAIRDRLERLSVLPSADQEYGR